MTPILFLTHLEIAGFTVTLKNTGQLSVKGPIYPLPTELVEQIRRCKPEICRILAEQPPDRVPVDDLRVISQQLPISVKELVDQYLTEDDLLDLRRGDYPDMVALGKALLSGGLINCKPWEI